MQIGDLSTANVTAGRDNNAGAIIDNGLLILAWANDGGTATLDQMIGGTGASISTTQAGGFFGGLQIIMPDVITAASDGNNKNDYTGVTELDNGSTFAVRILGGSTQASAIGAGNNTAGELVINGATLEYIGNNTSGITDHNFTMGNATSDLGATLSGNGTFISGRQLRDRFGLHQHC